MHFQHIEDYRMRRNKDDLSIMEKWHILQTIKQTHKRESITFDPTVFLPAVSLESHVTLPTFKHFKKHNKIFDQGTPKNVRHSCDILNHRMINERMELTRVKNEYFRNKLLKKNLSNKKSLGEIIRKFKDQNTEWIDKGK